MEARISADYVLAINSFLILTPGFCRLTGIEPSHLGDDTVLLLGVLIFFTVGAVLYKFPFADKSWLLEGDFGLLVLLLTTVHAESFVPPSWIRGVGTFDVGVGGRGGNFSSLVLLLFIISKFFA